MATAIITLRDGTKATIEGKSFIVDGLDDIPFIVHHPIESARGWVVTEPITGFRITRRAITTQKYAIDEARSRCAVLGATEHVRRKVAGCRPQ